MNDYSNFEVEDFLTDDYFIEWVKSPNNESNQFWNNWIMNHPEQKSKIELAAAAIKTLSYEAPKLPETFYASLKNDVDATINNNLSVQRLAPVRRITTWMKVAAVFIGIAVFAPLLYFYLRPIDTIKIVTAYKQVKTVELPDHSVVTLNANSTLEYPEEWNDDEREVTLKGEGFFRIEHIDRQEGAAKFTVRANDVNVEVLGTEFNVRSREDITAVMLQSGKVQLLIEGQNGTHVMKPNDFVSFNSKTKELNKQTVNPTYYTAWLNHKYSFSKASLKQVCAHLQEYYGLKFQINDTALANQEITGTLLLKDEQSLLQTLSSFLNANIKQQGNLVTISSK